MGRECPMVEVMKLSKGAEGGGESELSLELSIGGSYGNSAKDEGNVDKGLSYNPRSDLFIGKDGNGNANANGVMDLQRKREIQALRRQEARRKREDKLRKSRGLSLNGHMEERLVLEIQQLQARARDREIREKDGFSWDSGRRKERNGDGKELSLGLFGENKGHHQHPVFAAHVQFLPVVNGCRMGQERENAFRSSVRVNGSGISSMDCDSGKNGCLERSSSAVSDYQTTSHKGGSSSDTGSHSSSLHAGQRNFTSGRDVLKSSQVEHSWGSGEVTEKPGKSISSSSVQEQPTPSKSTEKSRPDTHSDQTNVTCSTSENTTSPLSKEVSVEKPPKPPNSQVVASVPHMPYVSTTGNGPNGKTITGFLYKYTKSEVSIMCVCHGTSFSPAEFVEHAGGVDVAHPLKHITILPSAFG